MWLQIVRHRTVRLQTKYTSFLLKVNLENAIIDKRILSICRRQALRVARRRGRGAVNTFQLSCFLQVAETLNFARAASTASWPACRSTVFSPRVSCRKT